MVRSENPQITLQLGKGTFVVQREGAQLRIGTKLGDKVMWEEEKVALDAFPMEARAALEEGDTQSEALRLALHGVVEAFAERGG